ncbi:hypothetical protein FACS189445_6380 [Spirochaetia bacterium]|nr:hypothetical protein FACS189445_6380 [Spirochaetia bacterium]
MMSKSEKTYALKQGFFVLESMGGKFTITVTESPGEPTTW